MNGNLELIYGQGWDVRGLISISGNAIGNWEWSANEIIRIIGINYREKVEIIENHQALALFPVSSFCL